MPGDGADVSACRLVYFVFGTLFRDDARFPGQSAEFLGAMGEEVRAVITLVSQEPCSCIQVLLNNEDARHVEIFHEGYSSGGSILVSCRRVLSVTICGHVGVSCCRGSRCLVVVGLLATAGSSMGSRVIHGRACFGDTQGLRPSDI